MTAANVNSATGAIIGQWRFLSPEVGYMVAFSSYSGTTPSGAYFTWRDIIDAMGAQQTGQSVPEIRGEPFETLDRIRRHIESLHRLFGGSSTKFDANTIMSYTKGSTYRSRLHSADTGSNGLKVANAASELIYGFIPEWGNGTSQANLDAKARAASKMGWSQNKTAELAKAVRREKPQSIRTVFDNIIKHRNNGLSVNSTIRKLI